MVSAVSEPGLIEADEAISSLEKVLAQGSVVVFPGCDSGQKISTKVDGHQTIRWQALELLCQWLRWAKLIISQAGYIQWLQHIPILTDIVIGKRRVPSWPAVGGKIHRCSGRVIYRRNSSHALHT